MAVPILATTEFKHFFMKSVRMEPDLVNIKNAETTELRSKGAQIQEKGQEFCRKCAALWRQEEVAGVEDCGC